MIAKVRDSSAVRTFFVLALFILGLPLLDYLYEWEFDMVADGVLLWGIYQLSTVVPLRQNWLWRLLSGGLLAASLLLLVLPFWHPEQAIPFFIEHLSLTVGLALLAFFMLMHAFGATSHVGLALLLIGTVGLLALHLFDFTQVNHLTRLPLLAILVGFILHASALKHESAY